MNHETATAHSDEHDFLGEAHGRLPPRQLAYRSITWVSQPTWHLRPEKLIRRGLGDSRGRQPWARDHDLRIIADSRPLLNLYAAPEGGAIIEGNSI